MALKLNVHLRQERVATLDIAADQWTQKGSASTTWALNTMSAAWRGRPPEPTALARWLADLLPENAQGQAWARRAMQKLMEAGHAPGTGRPGIAETLWGNSQAEYAGAVSFTRAGREETNESGYEATTDARLAELIVAATAEATNGHAGSNGDRLYGRSLRTAVSGMRPKIGVTRLRGNGWGIATGTALNTWIAKSEQRRHWPGEAGIESICQKAAALVHVPACRTLARVWAGEQVVLSERADRHMTKEGVVASHQEEWAQAVGWPGALRYDEGWRGEPGWASLYEVVGRTPHEREEQQARLTRMIAFAWCTGNGDLHRRNAGVAHVAGEDGLIVLRLAKAYDMSSEVGIQGRSGRMSIRIGGETGQAEIGEANWREHARQCGLDEAVCLEIVREVARNAPEALAEAQEQARSEDENIHQAAVDRRCGDMQEWVRKRGAQLEGEIALRARKQAGRSEPNAELVGKLRALRAEGKGQPRVLVGAGEAMDLVWEDEGGRTRLGQVRNAEQAARLYIRAGYGNAEDLPVLERTIAQTMAEERAKALVRTK